MRRTPQKQVPFKAWPEEDRNRWTAAFKAGDPFDDCGPAAHLADRTRQGLYYRYGCFLGFLMAQHPDVLALPPTERLMPSNMAQYVASRRQSCSERTVAGDLRTCAPVHLPNQRLVMAVGHRQTHRVSSATKTGTAPSHHQRAALCSRHRTD